MRNAWLANEIVKKNKERGQNTGTRTEYPETKLSLFYLRYIIKKHFKIMTWECMPINSTETTQWQFEIKKLSSFPQTETNS